MRVRDEAGGGRNRKTNWRGDINKFVGLNGDLAWAVDGDGRMTRWYAGKNIDYDRRLGTRR